MGGKKQKADKFNDIDQQNRNRAKKSKFGAKDASAAERQQELIDEAARRGIEVWQLQEELDNERSSSDDENHDNNSGDADNDESKEENKQGEGEKTSKAGDEA